MSHNKYTAQFDATHKEITSKIIIPALGIPSILLIFVCLRYEFYVMLGGLLHVVLASVNIYLTGKNREFKVFGRSFFSRSDGFDLWRWMANLVIFDPLLYYLLSPSMAVHFAAWLLLGAAALMDTYKRSYRLTIALTSILMFGVAHGFIFPLAGIFEILLLISCMSSFLLIIWSIESRLMRAMSQLAAVVEREARDKADMEHLHVEAAFGQQLRSISHEVNNILAVLALGAHQSGSNTIARAVHKLKTINSLVLNGATQTRKLALSTPREVIEDLRILILPLAKSKGCAWIEEIDDAILDHKYEEKSGALYLILQNLIKNSCEALQNQPHGEIKLSFSGNDQKIIVRISDNGPGLPKNPLFETIASTKKDGHGLGLRFVVREAETNGFNLICDPGTGSGASFTLTIPVKVASHSSLSPKNLA